MFSFWNAAALMGIGFVGGAIAGVLRGGSKIDQVSIVQTLSALLALPLLMLHGTRPENYTLTLLIAGLCAISLSDIDTRLVPDPVIIALVVVGGLHVALFCRDVWPAHLGAAVIVFVFMLLVNLLSKGGLGMGDVKLMAVIALFLGPMQAVAALMIGALPAALFAVALWIKTKDPKRTFAFAPFLALGALVMIYLG